MSKRILVIDGHPDADRNRLVHALAQAYWDGARAVGHDTRLITLADLAFPLLRSAREAANFPETEEFSPAREDLAWAQHVTFVFPLWFGGAPALLLGLLERLLAPRRACASDQIAASARLIVTMTCSPLTARVTRRAFGLDALRRNMLIPGGFYPVWTTLLGRADALAPETAAARLARVRVLGEEGA